MGLCSVYEWQLSKTVKLTDTYVVFVKMTPNSELVAIPECTNVSLPNYKYKEEIYRYGNTEKLFLIPDYGGLEDLSLEFLENYRDDEDTFSKLRVQDLVNICLNKLYTPIMTQYNDINGNPVNMAGYRHTDTISTIIVRVYKNNFEYPLLDYVFTDLKLSDYSSYELNYSTADLLKWTLKFSYQGYYVVNSPDDELEEEYNEAAEIAKKAGQAKADAEREIASAGRGPASSRNPVEDRENAIKAKQGAKDRRDDAIAEMDAEIAALEKERDEIAEEQAKIVNEMMGAKDTEKERTAYLAANRNKLEAQANLNKRKDEIAQKEKEKVEELGRTLEEARNKPDANPEDIEKLEAEFNKAKESLDENIKKTQVSDKDIKKLEKNLEKVSKAEAAAQAKLEKAEEKLCNYDEIQGRLKQLDIQLSGQNGIDAKIAAAQQKKKEIEREYEDQIGVLDDQIARFESKIPEGTEIKSERSILSDAETRSQHERANQKVSAWLSDPMEQIEEAEDPKTPFDETVKAAMEKHDAEVEASSEKDFARRVKKEGKEKRLGQQIQSEAGVGGIENVLGEITEIPELAELELDEDDDPSIKAAARDAIYGGMSQTGRQIIDMAHENADRDEAAQKQFAEKAGVKRVKTADGEVATVENAQEIYKHKDFQERVTNISMEMYKAGKDNPSTVYGRAQDIAFQEYLSGKLKLK